MPACPSSFGAAALSVSFLAHHAISARIRLISDMSVGNVTSSLNLQSGWVGGAWNEPVCSQSNQTCLDCEQNSDICLQRRPRWGPSYACATSSSYCNSYWWSKDMIECCPGSCQASGVDLAEAPCSLDVYKPNRFGFRLDHARRMSSFANAAYYGPTPAIEQWTCGACNSSGVKVEGSVSRISTTSRGTDPHDNFVLVAKLPPPREVEPQVAAAPLSALQNDECRRDVEWAFSTGRHAGKELANEAYGHMRDFAGVAYENATIEDFQRLFFCGEAHMRCGTPPTTCTSPPCSLCPVNPQPFTGGGCMVAFRGSNNLANFLADAEAWTVPVVHLHNDSTCEDCRIENGFHGVWSGLAPYIFANLEAFGCGPLMPSNNIFITGHSLGAAVGTLAAAHLRFRGFAVKSAYLFESPRVGNDVFKTWFDRIMKGTDVFRTVNQADIIPDVPYTWMGFEHVGKEVFFHSDDPTDYRVCEDDYECEQFKPNVRASVADHCQLAVVPGGDVCFAEKWVNRDESDAHRVFSQFGIR